MSAIDEATATLTGQHETARARSHAIGETGEYDRAVESAAKLHTQLGAILDEVDPTRPAWQRAARVADYARTPVASGMVRSPPASWPR
jgi:hypothetical protein